MIFSTPKCGKLYTVRYKCTPAEQLNILRSVFYSTAGIFKQQGLYMSVRCHLRVAVYVDGHRRLSF